MNHWDLQCVLPLYISHITKYDTVKFHAQGPMNKDIKCIIILYSKDIFKFFSSV